MDAKLVLRPPHLEVRLRAGHWPDLPSMHRTIRDAGYQPIVERTELVVTGRVVRRDGALWVELDRMREPVALRVIPSEEEPDTAEHLGRHVGETVELEGLWSADPDDEERAGRLAVTAVHHAG